MTSENEMSLKLECMKLAVASPGQDKLTIAASYWDFLSPVVTTVTPVTAPVSAEVSEAEVGEQNDAA